ncbi:recombinase family protein [Rhodococcus pyridinivorans]|uniref:recombinase family protein n=1 Tax=Rhodococcus pyridinivorans TaxID=103816 RepID=UPI0009C05AF9|nr:recombinase family protein [Rhodococcus pyridinivorans]
MLIGYARCSTAGQDLRAQRTALKRFGARDDRIYTDKGYTVADAHTYAVRS